MNTRYLFQTAVTGLKTNKSRSALTILGIVIGITSIILIMSISKGAQALILGEIQELGSATITIVPGKKVSGPSDFSNIFIDSLKSSDLKAIQNKSNVPTLALAMPMVIVPGSVSYQGETYFGQTIGSSELFSDIMGTNPDVGEMFSKEDVAQKASVAIIGIDVKEELFGDSEAVGEKIKIKNRSFRVIGVYPSTGSSIFFNVDNLIVIPYTTAQTYLLGTNYFNEIITRAVSEEAVPRTVHDIEATIRELHGIENPDDDDFNTNTQQDLANTVGTITSVLAALLSSVASIALVVGGVGIMNIMLVTVAERTREIGLRKAVGATYQDILTQFLIESVMLTLIGGVIGILLGGLLSFGASLILSNTLGINWTFIMPLSAVLLGVGVSAAVGLVFGLYPAKEAAKKSPIEALRYE